MSYYTWWLLEQEGGKKTEGKSAGMRSADLQLFPMLAFAAAFAAWEYRIGLERREEIEDNGCMIQSWAIIDQTQLQDSIAYLHL